MDFLKDLLNKYALERPYGSVTEQFINIPLMFKPKIHPKYNLDCNNIGLRVRFSPKGFSLLICQEQGSITMSLF